VKPFLLLGIRADDVAADDEYAAMLRFSGLDEAQLRRFRLEQTELGTVDLGQWSGIILGGGPFQASDPEDAKSATQRRVEAELAALLDDVVERDFPFLGACYGIGTLGRHQGAVVDHTFHEPISGIQIKLTEAGEQDPLFSRAGSQFGAYSARSDTGVLGVLPCAGISRQYARLCNPVPPRARPGWLGDASRGLQVRRLFRARGGRCRSGRRSRVWGYRGTTHPGGFCRAVCSRREELTAHLQVSEAAAQDDDADHEHHGACQHLTIGCDPITH